jgi:hypothetical protein
VWGAGPVIENPTAMPGARFFADTQLNFAENLLRYDDEQPALVFRNERGTRRSLSYGELRAEVARIAAGLRSAGVAAGDRVAGYLPNIPEATIAMLATASIGAIWSSCSPDFGVHGVLDRFGQIAPKVLFTADGYYYAGKQLDSLQPMAEALAKLTAVERVVVIPYLGREPQLASLDGAAGRASLWRDFGTPGAQAVFDPLPFNHPLYILYSSGTTGVPKCIVHGAGGTLLQHQKEHLLHTDLKRSDRVFYFTTCGWMMWNWLMSALGTRALRRQPVSSRARGLVAHGRGGAPHGLRHEREVPLVTAEERLRAGHQRRPHGAAHGALHRIAVAAGGLRLCLPCGEIRPAARLDLRRHRHRLLLRARLPHSAGLSRRDPVPRTRHGGRYLR